MPGVSWLEVVIAIFGWRLSYWCCSYKFVLYVPIFHSYNNLCSSSSNVLEGAPFFYIPGRTWPLDVGVLKSNFDLVEERRFVEHKEEETGCTADAAVFD